MVNKFDISELEKRLDRFMNALPARVGTLAVNFSKKRFRESGWRAGYFIPWRRRKPGAKRNKGRALLVSSGFLRNSIRIISKTFNAVTIGTDVKYAEAHNQGVNKSVGVKAHTRRKTKKAKASSIKTRRKKDVNYTDGEAEVKAHTRNMKLPKRQFIGNSKALENEIGNFIDKELQNIFK